MLRKLILSGSAICAFVTTFSQDSTKKATTQFSGSVDAYYKHDFSGKLNNKTSFTNSDNSFELGMASLKVDHTVGKVTATADLGFGRRAAEFSYNDGGSLALVKQLFVSYAVSNKVKLTAGKFATHIGYELVDAIANRNYSMSYGFSYGPFFHTGLKADIALGGKTAMMIGIANPTDFSSTTEANKYLIAQISTATKDDKLKAFFNYQGTSKPDFTLNQVDVVLLGVISDKFSINYNGTVQARKVANNTNSWTSNALYLNYDPTKIFGLTLRGEYLSDKNNVLGIGQESLFIPTLSANIKIDNLTIIPEFRFETAKNAIFIKSDETASKTASQFLIAATYRF